MSTPKYEGCFVRDRVNDRIFPRRFDSFWDAADFKRNACMLDANIENVTDDNRSEFEQVLTAPPAHTP